MRPRVVTSLMSTGAWLGLSQVAMGFHLLYGEGATVLFYFLLLNVWLTGSIVGLTLLKRLTRFSLVLHVVCLVSFAIAAILTRFETFSMLSAISVYSCAFLTGMFAGWFLGSQVNSNSVVSKVLLHENNGFILGYGLAGCLLFFSVVALDVLVLLAGVVSILLLWRK